MLLAKDLKFTTLTLGLVLLVCYTLGGVAANHDDESLEDPGAIDINDLPTDQTSESVDGTQDPTPANENSAKHKPYTSIKVKPEGLYMYENFDDEQAYSQKWVQSTDPRYLGRWQLNSASDRPESDLQLVLPQKARHYGISAKLDRPFKFSEDKPLIVQYEVQFRDGIDCAGAYIKLLRNSAINDLKKLTDKTPFSIMFGPDKCGSDVKLHFIIQYLNPKTQEYSEKHWKQAKLVSNLMQAFTDKRHHLFKLVLEPSNNFEIFLDDKSVGKGNLLEDMDPAINPPKEIVDENDKKPEDWDERPQIDDPDSTKPEDWDEDAPKTIEDPNATKPDDWLENEPKHIPDPGAKKPDDWEEMDGEWEAPLIDNPACAKVSGCGEWKPPTIANPNYKGKWKPSKIDNPNYKGKWSPRKIPNPEYFYDEKPFASLDAIGAVAFELWSMADNIAFDNLLVTNNMDSATMVQITTWQEKKFEADASSPSLVTRSMHYLKVHPWLWLVVVIGVALPVFLFISYCCDTKKNKSTTAEAARRKKVDESRPDTKASKSDGEEEDEAADADEEGEEPEQGEDEDNLEEIEEEDDEAKDAEVKAGDNKSSKRQVRQKRKV